jgi:4-diphosphocytidyl-2-C-methyl-D-erythritol kinase
MMRTVAPAKINWTLEVLGRRDDGYHEIRSVMQTIDLCDEVVVNRAPELRKEESVAPGPPRGKPVVIVETRPVRFNWSGYEDLKGHDGSIEGSGPMAYAVELLDPEWEYDANIHISKWVPVAAGLGGGSSDTAAVLRALNLLWDLGRTTHALSLIAEKIGSDVPFFLRGGTALTEGRGERITQLPDAPPSWLILVVPPIKLPEKTKRMYEAISSEDFSDGVRTEDLTKSLRGGGGLLGHRLCNSFERVAYRMFDGLEGYREALVLAGAQEAHLAGAGPTLFAITESEAEARDLEDRIVAPDAKVFVARTLTSAEATAIVD